jgi:hypothetical protein
MKRWQEEEKTAGMLGFETLDWGFGGGSTNHFATAGSGNRESF